MLTSQFPKHQQQLLSNNPQASPMTTAGYKLFTPLQLADDLVLKNRVVLAPLTRARSDPVTRAPVEINEIYYEQRAGAGLIITEASAVSEQGHGWYGAPALYTEEHAAAWAKVTGRVHAKGGKIFMQLWHIGRSGHSSFNAKHDLVSASAVKIESGHTKNAAGEYTEYETPRALETDEIPLIVEDFRKSAVLAKKAGFDGVELHSANGYLFDQFMQSCTNKRTDKYGGSFENRARFLIEVIEALQTVWPIDHIAVRLAPNSAYIGMGSPDNVEMFTYVMERLSAYKLAYLALLDGEGFGYHDKCPLLNLFDTKRAFKGIVLGGSSYTRDIAEGAIRSGTADFVSFGRPYIGTPDLAERFANDWPLNPPAGYETFWDSKKGASGYIDFPFYMG